MQTCYLAVDIGASSGRHIVGWVEDGTIKMEEVYRFPNGVTRKGGHLCWDTEALFGEILEGLRACARQGLRPVSMGVDTWAVDFVLLDGAGQPLGDTVAYRDSRTDGMDAFVRSRISDSELYARTGIQYQPFNTIYQLAAIRDELDKADSLLMIPDYFHYRLTGQKRFEYTNASSTGLLNAAEKTWDGELLDRLGYPRRLFPALSLPGSVVGRLTPDVQAQTGLSCEVVLPATHDTGSAFLAVPAEDENSVYLSSGTWSLLGVENPAPITAEASRLANFTNEGGYDYHYRYLKNIMGLWMVQELRRELAPDESFASLMAAAEAAEFDGLVDANDAAFLAPESMYEAVRAYCRTHGQPQPEGAAQALRCVYRSLAQCYSSAIAQLSELTGHGYNAIHIVGGGSNAAFLNRLTAQATGLPVYAGPSEATALGNLLAQMLHSGEFQNLQEARAAVRHSFPIQKF